MIDLSFAHPNYQRTKFLIGRDGEWFELADLPCVEGEFNMLEFDNSGDKTSLDNTVAMNGLEGAQAKFALGYSF